MKKFILFATTFIILSSCWRGTTVDLYERAVYNQEPNTELSKTTALTDVQNLLQEGYSKNNVVISKIKFNIQFDQALKDTIHIITKRPDLVSLYIGDEKNKTVALYSYLDLLGFRFYGAEDHWTYIPPLNPNLDLDTKVVSYFPYRRIFASYGVSDDAIYSLATSAFLFDRWKDRLRMVNLLPIPSGHYGKSFNEKYKQEILSNPEWRGVDQNGNVRPWTANLKLCYCNPDVINLFKRDALERLIAMKKKHNPPYILNMEPPDSGDFCDCKETISNQVYNLVNEVAEYLEKHDKNAFVSLYGYGYHAGPPTFSLRKNVIVGIAPKSVRSGGSPEKMIKNWENTTTPLYLRGYLGNPSSTMNKPIYNPEENFVENINSMRKKNYLGYSYETTSSFMSVGLGLYLLSKASWNEINEKSEFEAFLSNMFPNYEEEIRQVYQFFSNYNPLNITNGLNYIRNFKKKSFKNVNQNFRNRILDIEFFLEYLYLLEQFEEDNSIENTNRLLDKIMSEEGQRVLHSYGLFQVLSKKINTGRTFKIVPNLSVDAPQNNKVDLSVQSNNRYEVMNPEFYTDNLDEYHFIPVNNSSGIVYIGNNYDGTIQFNARLEPRKYGASGTIIIRDLKGTYIDEISLVPDDSIKNFDLKLPKNNFYNIEFLTPDSELYIQGPNRPFVFTESLFTRYIYQDAGFYFRVPKDFYSIKLSIPKKTNEVIVKQGNKILYQGKKDEKYDIILNVNEKEVVEVIMRRNGLKLLNIPQLLAIHKDGIIYKYDSY